MLYRHLLQKSSSLSDISLNARVYSNAARRRHYGIIPGRRGSIIDCHVGSASFVCWLVITIRTGPNAFRKRYQSLSYERLNLNCAKLNSTGFYGSGISDFIFGPLNNRFLSQPPDAYRAIIFRRRWMN